MSLKWYIVHVYSGMEKSVQKSLQDRIARAGLDDQFGKILVPSEKVEELRGGQKAVMERRLYPGYIFVEMLMNDDTWHLVKNTSKVSGFIGGTATRPSPVPGPDMEKIFSQMEDGEDKPRPKTLFNVGELVRVKEGPFADFNGNVEEVNYDKNTLRVSVTFFDRSTPVELDFSKVEKV